MEREARGNKEVVVIDQSQDNFLKVIENAIVHGYIIIL